MFNSCSSRDGNGWAQIQEQVSCDSSASRRQHYHSTEFQQLGSLPPLPQQYSSYNVATAAAPTYPSASSQHQQAYRATNASHAQPLHLRASRIPPAQSVNGGHAYALDEVQSYDHEPTSSPLRQIPTGSGDASFAQPVTETVDDQRPRKKARKEKFNDAGQQRRGTIPKAAPPRKPSRRGGIPDTPENRAAYAQEQAQANAQPHGPFVSNIDRPSTTRESGITRGRLIDRFPPVIGSYLHYPNKVLFYRGIPSDVDRVREALFRVQEPVLLATSQAIADYWPHCSNIWQRLRRHTGSKFSNEGGAMVEIYECRLHERVRESHRVEPTQNIRKRGRKTDHIEDGEGKDCRFRVAVSTYTVHADTSEEHGDGLEAKCKCIPEWLHMSKLPPSNDCYKDYDSHSHSLRLLNKLKNSAAIMFFAKVKVEQGYSYQAVYDWMEKVYGQRTQQMEFFAKRDVCNVSREWREANPDRILRPEVEAEAGDNPDTTAGLPSAEKCHDAITSASPMSLRGALIEICNKIPAAAEIALSILDYDPPPELSTNNGVRVGYDMQVPYPGIPVEKPRPSKKVDQIYHGAPSLSAVLLNEGERAASQPQPLGRSTPARRSVLPHRMDAGLSSTADDTNLDPSLARQANAGHELNADEAQAMNEMLQPLQQEHIRNEIREHDVHGPSGVTGAD